MKNKSSYIFFLFFSFFACAPDEETIDCFTTNTSQLYPCAPLGLASVKKPSENLFIGTGNIEITPYEIIVPQKYVQEYGNRLQIKGDSSRERLQNLLTCCEIGAQIDLNLPEPIFEWKPINRTNVVAAISKKPFILNSNGKSINNRDDVVWLWYKEWNTGIISQGKRNVNYEDGKGCKAGVCEQINPLPLKTGELYYWAVWAWSEDGVNLEFSSKAIPFIVESIKSLPVVSLKQLDGIWDLDYAQETLSQTDVTNVFSVRNMDIFITCDTKTGEIISAVRTFPINYSITEYFGSSQFILRDSLQQDSLFFYDVELNCDDRLTGKVLFDGEEVEVAYNLRN